MTSQEPGTAAEPTTTAGDHDTAVDSTPPSRRQSRWSKLNRTNRIAAFVLGGVASVFVAALIFGAGVLVGAEFGDSEGHHRGSETADYGAGGGDGSGEHEGSGSEGNGTVEATTDRRATAIEASPISSPDPRLRRHQPPLRRDRSGWAIPKNLARSTEVMRLPMAVGRSSSFE